MISFDLAATKRDLLGKGNARKYRASGVIPASMYREGKEPTLITINPKDLTMGFTKTNDPNTLVNIKVDKDVNVCLVKTVDRHPVSGAIRHVDFYIIKDDEPVTIDVKVETTGQCIGIKMGGKLRTVKRELTVKCLPKHIPSSIPVDVTTLEPGQFVRVSQVVNPEGCELIYPADFNVIAVAAKR